jgi:hypothetical protein
MVSSTQRALLVRQRTQIQEVLPARDMSDRRLGFHLPDIAQVAPSNSAKISS